MAKKTSNSGTEKSPGTGQVMRRFLSVNKRHGSVLILTIVFSLVTSAALGLMTQSFQKVIDDFGVTGSIFSMQTIILAATLIVLIPSQYLQQFCGIKYSELCDRNLRNKTFGILSQLDMQVLDTQRTGDLLSRANNDLSQINGSLQNYFAVRLPQEIMGVAALVVSLFLNWQLTLFSLAAVPIFAIIQMIISAPLHGFIKKRQQAAGESLSIANNLMGGYEVAKAYNMGATMKGRYEAAIDRMSGNALDANRAMILLSPLSQILFFLPQIVICGFGVYLASIQQITAGGIMSVLILSALIRNPISDLSSVLSNFQTARGCASRVFELWDFAPEPKGGTQAKPQEGSIVFKDVEFTYPDKPPVLKGLSFEIKPGEHVALVGSSGCGKSTALKLLMGLYRKNAGELSLFGHPVEEWDTDALRELISYVGQDTYLFTGGIWDNVAMGKPGATDAQIQAVIDAALLGELDVKREIGEQGLRLSGGQRQRAAIARAMLKDAPLLLLDEPTSALDTQSEAQVSEALNRLMKGRTTVIVAHRLSALRGTERILCMDDGRIAESGTHAELMALGGVYYRLYQSQEEMQYEKV